MSSELKRKPRATNGNMAIFVVVYVVLFSIFLFLGRDGSRNKG